ncbi:hypothetical protein WQE_47234 [Paraburkholderia hospita]|uniref:Uncharacterized protein n=1 Tax=Paraburkholderia hospita TaxID=169430 RepID=A0ABP2P847_9BURK|nr:hypothetical protein WQE_47234 [Paraburkholderia hospita]
MSMMKLPMFVWMWLITAYLLIAQSRDPGLSMNITL